MNINDAFPSKYLRAHDLGDKQPVVIIDKVTAETVGEDTKLVVYFRGKDKGLVLNKTNANSIMEITGSPITEEWTGHRIMLVTAKVEYQGKRVPAVRIERPAPPAKPLGQRASAPPPPPPVEDRQGAELTDDDIPF